MANWNNDQDRYNNRFNDEDFNYEGGYGRRNFNRDNSSDFDRGYYGQGNDQWSNSNRGYNTDYNRSYYGRDYDNDMNYNRGYYNRGFYGRGSDYNRGYGSGRNQSNYGGGYSGNRGYYGGSNYGQNQGGFGGNRGYYGAGNQGNYGYGGNQGYFGGYQGGGNQDFYGASQNDFDQDYGMEGDYGVPFDYIYTEYWLIPGPETGNGPQGYQRSDNRIMEDVCDRLAQHGRIDARDINIDVKNGEVTLNGTVKNRNAKRMAEDVAESVMGVEDVHNNLKVKQENKQAEGRQSSQKSMTGSTSRRSQTEKSGSNK